MIRVVLACLILAGCDKPANISDSLPEYSDMGAAADAGRAPFDNP